MRPETREWLGLADEDLRMAELACGAGLLGPCCFHCQQAAEKSM